MYRDMEQPAVCDTCEQPAALIVSLPAVPARAYEGGLKIAPWTLPPVRNRDGSVATNPDGSIKMQQIEVGSRKEFMGVLKRNGLREFEANSENLVQGGLATRQRSEAARVKDLDEARGAAKDHARFKRNPEQARKVINEACAAGEKVRSLSQPAS